MKTLNYTEYNKLQKGDKLTVIDNLGTRLAQGQTVTVDEIALGTCIYLSGFTGAWAYTRFALANHAKPPVTSIVPVLLKKPAKPRRDILGRFLGTTPQVVREKPTVLRNGSLYAIKRKHGTTIARLRKPAHEDYLVFSEHDKRPFLARKKQVRLADAAEVKAYLGENATA